MPPRQLSPIGQTSPYYSININSTSGAWTSKFVFIAGNAWDSAQSSWLSTTLAVKTTYTFVIRHEATEANTAPGVYVIHATYNPRASAPGRLSCPLAGPAGRTGPAASS